MIKDTLAANEAVTPNSREMAVLKDTFPSCFHADGTFDLDRFKEFLSDQVSVVNEGSMSCAFSGRTMPACLLPWTQRQSSFRMKSTTQSRRMPTARMCISAETIWMD